MIIYNATRAQFTRDVFANVIEERILAELRQHAGHGVAREYRIPLTAKRVDFILSGLDEDKPNNWVAK